MTARDLEISFAAASGGVRPVVHGIGFELRRGRTLALVGESGSGKSVTAMSLLGLLPPSASVSGSIRLGDDELVGAPTALLRQVRGGRIGTIFQEPMSAFNPVLPIGWQITEALRAHGRGGSHDAARDRVTALLESVGLPDPERVRRAFPHELSGGQLQRAMIAMALSGDPEILIADEPTTALDVTVQAGILDLLRSVRERFGTAILLITHDMGVVADLADDVIVMREGSIVERADVIGLFASPQADYTRALLDAVPTLAPLDLEGASTSRTTAEGAQDPRGLSPREASTATPAALLDAVDISYGSRRGSSANAVDGVSLTVPAGRIVGLVGESGSGKSTIGRALAGLVSPHAGRVLVGGTDLTRASRRDLRKVRASIGYVFQDPASSLNPRSSIGDSIAEPLRLHSPLDAAGRSARVRELLDAVQLPRDVEGRFQHELSGGQRQRVAIARAIALQPALLIADEPTSALDVSVQARVLDLLRELQRDLGFACLFISHDLAVVGDLADEVAVMHRGRIVERGPTDDVLRRPQDAYTRRLLAAAPVADPDAQRVRREAWRELTPDPAVADAALPGTAPGAAA
ncbi:glutathione ABC transporter ATP-binding protein [Frondihabitans sp. PAMC 28766]|nr:glutathione ABC transporter ATP-binding protein [Frondihabitans sp. PAMC 28766]